MFFLRAVLSVNALPLPPVWSRIDVLRWAADRCGGHPRAPGHGTGDGFHKDFCHEEIGTSTLPHETNRSSDALKHPRIQRAVSTLVYATPLHPASRMFTED